MKGTAQVVGVGRPRPPADGAPDSTGADVPSRSWLARLFLAGGFAVAAWALLTVLAAPAQAGTGSAVLPGHVARQVPVSIAAVAHSRAGIHPAPAHPASVTEHAHRSTSPASASSDASSALAAGSAGHTSTPAHAAAAHTHATSSLLDAAQSRRPAKTSAAAAARRPANTTHSPTQHRGETAASAATTSRTSAGTTDRSPSPLAPRPEPAEPNAPAPAPTGGDVGHGHGAGGPHAAVLTGAELRAHPESVAVPLPAHPAAALDTTDDPGSHPD